MDEEIKEDQLDGNESVELSEEDKKIAARRAKKRGIPVEISEQARRQELNAKQAQKLTIEFNEKLCALGFILEPVLKMDQRSIEASFQLRPMNSGELNNYDALMVVRKEKMKEEVVPSEAVDGEVQE